MQSEVSKNSIVSRTKLHKSMVIREFTDEHMASRLMSMGVLPGTIIEIDRIAPWRGGYCLKVQGQKIALRYAEAASIIVE